MSAAREAKGPKGTSPRDGERPTRDLDTAQRYREAEA